MKQIDITTKYLNGLKTRQTGNLIVASVTKEALVPVVSSLKNTFGLPLLSIKATDERKEGKGFVLYYLFGIPKSEVSIALELALGKETSFPSLVGLMYETSLYEQEIETFFGLTAEGHPYTQQFILHENWPNGVYPLRKDFAWNKKVPTGKGTPYVFSRVAGEGIYEIPVGPVHAGVIEPGHFRFSVAGEEILALQPQLGFVHKGSEKLFEVLPFEKKLKLSEHISGDTSFSHSLAFCQALETLGGIEVPKYAEYLRVIFSELERLANHFNDIGFILNDTGFAVGGSIGTRFREHIMQLNEGLVGNRFLRGVNTVGGVTKDISEELKNHMVELLDHLRKEFDEFVEIAEDNETVLNRLQYTGILEKRIAEDHGVVGMVARMVGIHKDARVQYPYAGYKYLHITMATQSSGDVYARYRLRIQEVRMAMDIIKHALVAIKKEKPELSVKAKPLAKNALAVGITEGWRGEIVYLVATDEKGEINRVGVRDPSFLNWPVVPFAVVKNIVPDFPLINKSFNLSYSGFDR
ncbi:MAG TPA: NADH-quinone oxidoreductase subunit C [Patescibacteria group bacterium]|nr:NADH-quinone oxidoreductase subunit C [Patescibacteria group bacterium]